MNTLDIAESEKIIEKELIYSVNETFSSMLGVEPKIKSVKILNEGHLKGDVSGIIQSPLSNMNATLFVSFPQETIFSILEILLRKKITVIDNSVKQAVGEFTNMIYGVMKNKCNSKGFGFSMALPNIVMGEAHAVSPENTGKQKILLISLQINGKDFEVMFSMSQV